MLASILVIAVAVCMVHFKINIWINRRALVVAETERSANHSSSSTQRSRYGYRRPQPPYHPIKHTSHTCIVNRNTSSEEVINIPTGVPNLILMGAQKSATSEFQVLANKHNNVITPLSVNRFEPHYLEHVRTPLLKHLRDSANDNHTSSEFNDKVDMQI